MINHPKGASTARETKQLKQIIMIIKKRHLKIKNVQIILEKYNLIWIL